MPNGILPILKFIKYRLSRVYTGGNQDYITYNRMVLYTLEFGSASAEFVEGFAAKEMIVEVSGGTFSFRKQTSSPQMLFEFDKFVVIGSERILPQLRSKLSFIPAPFGLKVNDEHEVFSVKIRDCDASHGQRISAYNCISLGTNTNIDFFYRDVRSIGGQRNILGARAMLTATPAPEKIIEPEMETIDAP